MSNFLHRLKESIRKSHQNKIVRGLIYLLLIFGFPLVGIYMFFIEPRLVQIEKIRIPIKKKLSRPLKVVQISDIHFGPTNYAPAFIKSCVNRINKLDADMVVMTGDFMQWNSEFAVELAGLLSKITSRLGTFAVLGNHDYGVCHPNKPATDPVDHEEVIAAFTKEGIRILHNEHVTWEEEGLALVGLGDYWTEHFKPHLAFTHTLTEEATVILLSHNPDTIHPLKDFDFDLMLSGHVHGGQVSWPFIGPLVVPVKERKFRRGLHWVNDRWLYTNRGLGFIFRARLLSRPEISVLEIVEG